MSALHSNGRKCCEFEIIAGTAPNHVPEMLYLHMTGPVAKIEE